MNDETVFCNECRYYHHYDNDLFGPTSVCLATAVYDECITPTETLKCWQGIVGPNERNAFNNCKLWKYRENWLVAFWTRFRILTLHQVANR